ncbi:uncharacterized protein B0H18DRAFT_332002 [Fomitopsis serialis]|uniref:uncharacterized protein n=1 Tax=Fomitopsis serialis TaxID=139415 RepID=UPI0020086370|nr:uncharacterized protein B0H18DRAFT_332002 [Neoantrodia serialis]KAH9926751.1 hypothetical protein B0H18DRAFT_332002 [Neoantrodia serialis]
MMAAYQDPRRARVPLVCQPFKTAAYTSLNFPKHGSQPSKDCLRPRIRERYRQLSVLFHPDKHQDETAKATATKRFLEIQKAYQVLSDPISRRAYDLLAQVHKVYKSFGALT